MLPSVWGNKVLTSTGKALSNGSQGDSLPQGRPNYSPKLRGAVWKDMRFANALLLLFFSSYFSGLNSHPVISGCTGSIFIKDSPTGRPRYLVADY